MSDAHSSGLNLAPSKRSTLWSGGIFVLTNTVPRAIGFLLLPLYTHVLSPADYGQLSVALTVAALAVVIFSFGLEAAIFRNVFQFADDAVKRQRFILSTWTFLLFAPLAMALVVSVALGPLLAANKVLTGERVALSLVGAAIFVSATTTPLAVLRTEQRLRKYVLINAVATVSTTSLILVLVVVAGTGVTGWLTAVILGNLITLGVSLLVFPYARPRPFDRRLVRDALSLSLPVVPHLMAMLALQLADRVLVATLLSTSAAGLYSLASNMAMPMMLAVLGFGQAFMPTYARIGKARHEHGSLTEIISIQVALISLFCVACALLAPPAVHLVAASDYGSGADLTVWIVLGYGFWGFYQIPMNSIVLTYGRTKGLVLISGISAITNIGMILALAPTYGLESVAIASAAGYAALLCAVSLFARVKHASLPYPWQKLAVIIAIAVTGYTAGVITTGSTTVLDVAVRTGWIAVTVVATALVVRDRRMLRTLPKLV